MLSTVFGNGPASRGSTSVSEAPSMRAIARAQRPREPIPEASNLFCEFLQHGPCMQRFDIDDVNDWIRHVSEHLGGNFPLLSMCWFCHERFEAASSKHVDRERRFTDRMRHIAMHFRSGLSQRNVQPDHFLGLVHTDLQRDGRIEVRVELSHRHRQRISTTGPYRSFYIQAGGEA